MCKRGGERGDDEEMEVEIKEVGRGNRGEEERWIRNTRRTYIVVLIQKGHYFRGRNWGPGP